MNFAALITVSLFQLILISSPQPVTSQDIDGKDCNTSAVSGVLPVWEMDKFKRKDFVGCTIRRGELATISNRLNVPVNIVCWRRGKTEHDKPLENADQLEDKQLALNIKPMHAFIINVYVNIEDIQAPRWECYVKRSDPEEKEMVRFDVFTDYKIRESFSYEVTGVGVYQEDPRLTAVWRMPKREAA